MSAEKQKTILLVEDEAIIAMVEKTTLERFGYKVIMANTGEEAVAVVGKTPAIDLILMDINLGAGIDGAEAAEIILQDHDIPIMFLSSHTEPEFVARTEKITAYGFIVKNSCDTVFQALIKMVFKLYEAKRNEWKKGSQDGPALKAFQDSEEKYRLLVENINDVLYTLDASGRITYISPVIERVSGREPAEFVGKNFSAFVHPDDFPILIEKFKQAMDGARESFEFRVFNGDQVHHVRTSSQRFLENGIVAGLTGLMSDISEQKRAEAVLLENNSRLELAMQAANMAWWEMDLATGNVIFEKRKADMLDFPPEKFKHYNDFMTLVHPEDHGRAMDAMRGYIEGSLSRYEVEYRISTRSGEYQWFHDIGSAVKKDAQGKPLKITGLVINITKRKQAEKLAEALFKISQSSYSTASLQELFMHVHHVLSIIIPTNNLFIALISDDGKVLNFPYNIDEKDSRSGVVIGMDNAQSLTVEVCRENKPLLLNETELFERYASGRNKVWGTAPKCWLGVPLTVGETVIGVLAVQDYHNGSAYSRKDVSLLESAAGQIAIAIDRKRTETQREAALKALHESEERFHSLFDNMDEGVALHEMVFTGGKPVNYRIVDVNDRYVKILGVSREQVVGRLATEAYGTPDAPYFDIYVDVSINKKTINFETFYARLDKHFAISVAPWHESGFATIFFDISERKRAGAALQKSELQLKAMLDNSPAVVLLIQGGKLVYLNPTAEKITGWKEVEFLGKNFTDFVYQGDREIVVKNYSERMAGDGFLAPYVVRLNKKNGGFIYAEINGTVIDLDGTPTMLGFLTDISERRRAEEEITRQLMEKEILLKEVHHRIKNNIANIGGLISLRLQTITNPEAAAVLQDTIGQIDSMRILYEKLLLSESYEDISVKNYAESLVDTFVTLFPGKTKVKLEKHIADFKLDSKRLFPLGIIINELLTNIMKYAFIDKKAGSIKISLASAAGRVSLAIQDNGKGLPDGFDIKESKGFGLMLVKMLSQQLGGSFSMESHNGTRCKIEFDERIGKVNP
jgi:PAS domain S-box-containing protein